VSGDGDERDPFLRELAEAGVEESDAMDALVDGLEPAPLPSALRARILASVKAESRFLSFADQVAALVDVAVDRAKELLLGIDAEESWGDSIVPAMRLYNFDGGPSVANAITGFVRMPPGSAFPHHVHVGQETVLVLQGQFREDNGDVVGPSEKKVSDAGSAHSFEVLDGPELIYLVVVQEGVELGGETIGPEDPRL